MKGYIRTTLTGLICLAVTDIGHARPVIDYRDADFSIERVLDWGSRPVLSPDSTRMAFTESDTRDSQAYELDLDTKSVRCVTCHLGMEGLVTRIYYLPDGNYIILARRHLGRNGPVDYRTVRSVSGQQELYWLSKSGDGALLPLHAPAFGDLAITLDQADGGIRIAWGETGDNRFRLHTGRIDLRDGRGELTGRRTVFDSKNPHNASQVTFAEAYDFAEGGKAITFYTIVSENGRLNGEMFIIDIVTGKIAPLYSDPAHNETHLFPDQRFGLEEANRDSDPDGEWRGVSSHPARILLSAARRAGLPEPTVEAMEEYSPFGRHKGIDRPFDLYVVTIDGSSPPRRLTDYSDVGANTHQSVVSRDGRLIAFAVDPMESRQMASKGGIYLGRFSPKTP